MIMLQLLCKLVQKNIALCRTGTCTVYSTFVQYYCTTTTTGSVYTWCVRGTIVVHSVQQVRNLQVQVAGIGVQVCVCTQVTYCRGPISGI
jgi:hypothetical protein